MFSTCFRGVSFKGKKHFWGLLEPTMLQASKKLQVPSGISLVKGVDMCWLYICCCRCMKKTKLCWGETNTLTKGKSTNIELEATWPMVHC